MKALSIRQPWAWLILHAGKDIENRRWLTTWTGRFLIHASKGMTRREYDEAKIFALKINPSVSMPRFEEIERGGIVGEANLVTCVDNSLSPWFFGPFGMVLENPKPTPFWPYPGQLGFFDVQTVPTI